MIGNDNQTQKAGDGSQQIQAGTYIINNNNGIDEKRAREIFMEMFGVARKELSEDAFTTATRRVTEFENDLIPRIQKIDGAINAFTDPAFQFLLTNAHKTAASTDRTSDYELLSELLIHRIQNGTNRNTITGINRAVEIVNEITNESLLGLTLAFAVQRCRPASGILSEGLDTMDNLFGTLCYENLPIGLDWIDQLDILDAVRMSNFTSLKKFDVYYTEELSGYCVLGIKKGSEKFIRANEVLNEYNLPTGFLITNELNDEYVRIPVVNEKQIDKFQIMKSDNVEGNIITSKINLNEEQNQALHQIYSMYDDDKQLKMNIKQNFCKEISKRTNLSKIQEWWNQIPYFFYITAVGKVLAHINAKRCDVTFPDFN